MKKGFTLIEVLVVIAIVATISVILILVLNPIEYLRQARDAQRLHDAVLINQAINFYKYNVAVAGGTPDLDGPNYSEACAGQPSSTLFVSVPQGGEQSPAPPPNDWEYNRVPQSSLNYVNGSGWLPIDFSGTVGIQALAQLPVDPINTFSSGYYYTYTCGSYELDMRFESGSYQKIAQNDGGDDADVYETGDDLTIAPWQAAYHPATSTTAGSVALYPVADNPTWDEWNGMPSGPPNTYADINDQAAGTYISSQGANTVASVYQVQSATQTGNITDVVVVMRASQFKNKTGTPYVIAPLLYSPPSALYYQGAAITLPKSSGWGNYSQAFTTNPNTGQPWTWVDINSLQVGVAKISGPVGGVVEGVEVAQLYALVDYQ